MSVVEPAQRGVPVGFEAVGDEPVGGVDGQVAAAGEVGVVAGALRRGGAHRVGVGGALFEFGGHGEGGLDAPAGISLSSSSRPIRGVEVGAGDG